jgi:hypothetical protein
LRCDSFFLFLQIWSDVSIREQGTSIWSMEGWEASGEDQGHSVDAELWNKTPCDTGELQGVLFLATLYPIKASALRWRIGMVIMASCGFFGN